LPPVEITPIDKHIVLSQSLFTSTRGYLEKIVYQINTSYENTCYDACSVMIRRLIEILIIETYEHNGIEYKIKNSSGDFLLLEDLINNFLSEKVWNLNPNTKRCLSNTKKLGDLSAHSRRYNTNRNDLEKIINELRVTVEELLYLSGLKQ
ncbi:DUF4145 domain-containing protein, partial [Chloroflexota bacterium]